MKADEILKAWHTWLAEKGEAPRTVRAFCAHVNLEEAVFYQYFTGFEALDGAAWAALCTRVLTRVQEEEVYDGYTAREKLLSFYFTLFEEMKANRSSWKVLWGRKGRLQLIPAGLAPFKTGFQNFCTEILGEGMQRGEVEARVKLGEKYAGLHWPQCLYLLRTWMLDTSAAFQRTDEAVERAVNLGFDLMGRNVLDSAAGFIRFAFRKNSPSSGS